LKRGGRFATQEQSGRGSTIDPHLTIDPHPAPPPFRGRENTTDLT
jgi:hypothetical protein